MAMVCRMFCRHRQFITYHFCLTPGHPYLPGLLKATKSYHGAGIQHFHHIRRPANRLRLMQPESAGWSKSIYHSLGRPEFATPSTPESARAKCTALYTTSAGVSGWVNRAEGTDGRWSPKQIVWPRLARAKTTTNRGP